jgi:hypothetical protein
MDKDRFDQLSRTIATTSTRRQLLRGLILGATATAIAGISPVTAEAKPPPPKCLPAGSGCRMNSKCCTGVCCGGVCCVAGQGCLNGQCCAPAAACPSFCCPTGQTCCSGNCVTLGINDQNCGGCGITCRSDQICSAGKCICDGAGLTECSGKCANTQTDSSNCGHCGISCSGGETCVSGTCLCDPGFDFCSGKCVSINTDPSNCGGCGQSCGSGQVCSGGSCVCDDQVICDPGEQKDPVSCACECPSTSRVCDGFCTDIDSNPFACGGCGITCSGGKTCVSGTCSCPSGQIECSGACVDSTTNANCNSCGNVCSPADGELCCAGKGCCRVVTTCADTPAGICRG